MVFKICLVPLDCNHYLYQFLCLVHPLCLVLVSNLVMITDLMLIKFSDLMVTDSTHFASSTLMLEQSPPFLCCISYKFLSLLIEISCLALLLCASAYPAKVFHLPTLCISAYMLGIAWVGGLFCIIHIRHIVVCQISAGLNLQFHFLVFALCFSHCIKFFAIYYAL